MKEYTDAEKEENRRKSLRSRRARPAAKLPLVPRGSSRVGVLELDEGRKKLLADVEGEWPEVLDGEQRLLLYARSRGHSYDDCVKFARGRGDHTVVYRAMVKSAAFKAHWEDVSRWSLPKYEGVLDDWAMNGERDNAHARVLELKLKSLDRQKYGSEGSTQVALQFNVNGEGGW